MAARVSWIVSVIATSGVVAVLVVTFGEQQVRCCAGGIGCRVVTGLVDVKLVAAPALAAFSL